MATIKSDFGWASADVDALVHAPTLPGSVVDGDLLVCFFSCNSNPSITTASEGWVKLGQNSYLTQGSLAVFFKVASADNTLVINLSVAQRAAAYSYCLSGADYVAGAFSSNAVSNSASPAFTAVSGTRPYKFLTCRAVIGNTSNPTAPPAGYGAIDQILFPTFQGVSIAVAGRDTTESAQAQTNWTVTGTTGNVTATVAIYDVPKITGTVRNELGVFASRSVRAHVSATGGLPVLSGGRVQVPVSSDADTGFYSLQCPTLDEHYVVVRSDGPNRQALIFDRKVPE